MKTLTKLAALAATVVGSALAQPVYGQTDQDKTLGEISFTYSTLQTNAPVGGCGCFWMRGGSAEVAIPVWRYVSGVGEISGEYIDKIPGGGGVGLDLLSGMGGLRVSRLMHTRYVPFGQGLVGAVHATNSFFPGAKQSSTSATSLAMAAGLGLDVAVSRHVLVRPIQAEYQYMQLPNGSTNEQHDVRLSAGVVFRFTR